MHRKLPLFAPAMTLALAGPVRAGDVCRRIGDRASFSFGASFSGGESSAGAGFGLDL